jgi:hypothetical protein
MVPLEENSQSQIAVKKVPFGFFDDLDQTKPSQDMQPTSAISVTISKDKL